MKAKVNSTVCNNVKRWVDAGAKDKNIAKAFDCSIATVQNIKRTSYSFKEYRNLVNNQMKKWRDSSKYNYNPTPNNNNSIAIKEMSPMVKRVYDTLALIGTQKQIKSLDKKIDLLTERFDLVFPNNKVKTEGDKDNERANSSV
jgi:hypothetical protein|tara:strand:+ start:943 stop:1371 length:429 start_codon:yes stop_codon:yes gene_type:complete